MRTAQVLLLTLAQACFVGAAPLPKDMDAQMRAAFRGCEAADTVRGSVSGSATPQVFAYLRCSESQKGRLVAFSAKKSGRPLLTQSPEFPIDRIFELGLDLSTGGLHVRVVFRGEPVETLTYTFICVNGGLKVSAIENEITYNSQPPLGQAISNEVKLNLATGRLFDAGSKSLRTLLLPSRRLEEFDPWENKGLGVGKW